MTEKKIQDDVRKALNLDGRCRVTRYSVGFDAVNKVRYGNVGWPDLIGVLRNGVAFCVEVKTPTGRVSPEQEAFWRAARKWGVRGGVARSVSEALTLLHEACK